MKNHYIILFEKMETASHDVIQLIIGKDSQNTLCRYGVRDGFFFLNLMSCLNKHWNRQMQIYINKTYDPCGEEYGNLKFWIKWNWNIYKTISI